MRDSHLCVPIDQVDNWYRALKTFYDLARHPRNLVEFKLEPGTTVFLFKYYFFPCLIHVEIFL